MTAASLLTLLLRASIEGALFVLLVGAVTRIAPRMPAGARCALWWLASLRLLLGLISLPALRVPLPAIAAAPEPAFRAGATTTFAAPIWAAVVPLGRAATDRALALANDIDAPHIIAIALVAVWLAGFGVVVLAHARDARRLEWLWRGAAPIQSSEVVDWFAAWVGPERANRVEVRASAGVGSPLIMMGGFRTRILVPSTCLDHDATSLRMALAHEMSHVKRGDLGWGLVPALTQGVFWFHPLARWCVDEYTLTREEACDTEALRLSDAAPGRHGEMLVGFGVDSTRRVCAAASCGSSHVQHLKRRLRMLAHTTRSTRTQRAVAVGATFVIGLLAVAPVRFVSAQASPPAAPRKATHVRRDTYAVASGSFGFSTGDDLAGESFSYGYSQGSGQTMSGNFDSNDQGWLDRLNAQGGCAYGWIRLGRKTCVVKGPDDIARIKEAMLPEMELGRQQGKLGDEQGRLGDAQSELGDLQSELGDQQSGLGEELASRCANSASR